MTKQLAKHRFTALVIALLVSLLALVAVALQPMQSAQADPANENMQVDVSVANDPNGPYDITITAKQLTADDPQWDSDTTLYFNMTNIVKLPEESKISTNYEATVTRNNDYALTVKGYDYSANVGEPLTITIKGATLNKSSSALYDVNGAADINLLYSSSYIWRDGHDYHFTEDAMPTVPVIWYGGEGPEPTWDGKTTSWEAFDTAESYDIALWGPGENGYETLYEGNTTDLEFDCSDYINLSGRYVMSVWAVHGDVRSQSAGRAEKHWYSVNVVPTYLVFGETIPTVGTKGGTLAGSAKSGDTFTTNADGSISGIFGEGDEITITGTAKDGYHFDTYRGYHDGSEYVDKDENPLVFTIAGIKAAWMSSLPKMSPNRSILR